MGRSFEHGKQALARSSFVVMAFWESHLLRLYKVRTSKPYDFCQPVAKWQPVNDLGISYDQTWICSGGVGINQSGITSLTFNGGLFADL
jgi:hypothetical protein